MATMTVNEWLKRRKAGRSDAGVIERATCFDGFSLSIQASRNHYCSPREDVGPWSAVEIGYPSKPCAALAEYAEDPDDLTETVYGWVPVEVVESVLAEHGGII